MIDKFSNENSELDLFQHWFSIRCDGSWEKKLGIKIDTLDNPGWEVIIDLLDTPLIKKQFVEVDKENNPSNWIQCEVKNSRFQGFGGPENLTDILQIFSLWSETPRVSMKQLISQDLEYLQRWYIDQCNGDWEHEYGIKIDTIDNPGWSLVIDLFDTSLEDKFFNRVRRDITENNWVHCWVSDSKFQGAGGPLNLVDLIRIFVKWVDS